MDKRKNIFPCTLNLPFFIPNFTFAPPRRAGAGSSGRVANAARGVPALCGRVANAARGGVFFRAALRQAAHIFTSISEKTEYFFK